MVKRIGALLMLLMGLTLPAASGAWAAGDKFPAMVQKNCLNCHSAFDKMPGVLAGNLSGKSMDASTLQIKINNKQEAVKFTQKTKLRNAPKMDGLKSGVALRVHYKMDGNARVATKVVVKPKFEVPDKQLMKVDELAELIKQGPQKGGYTLVDSRPPAGFAKGHIPTAVNLPFPKMKKNPKLLPQDKAKLLVFYCQGFR